MKELLKNLKINLTKNEEETFKLYYEFIISENEKYNLTRITDKKEVIIKHFYDSLTLLETGLFTDGISVCDIGSGAGFPGIPLAVLKPKIDFVLVESQGKKANFLKQAII